MFLFGTKGVLWLFWEIFLGGKKTVLVFERFLGGVVVFG